MILNDHYQFLFSDFIPDRNYVLFSGPTSFTISYSSGSFNGAVYYSFDNHSYTKWKKENIVSVLDSSDNLYKIYFQGKNNTQLSTFNITGSDVSVSGNICAIFDSKTASLGVGKNVDVTSSFRLVNNNSAITSAKDLRMFPSTYFGYNNYLFQRFFKDWTALTEPPKIYNFVNSGWRWHNYDHAFENCTSLVKEPFVYLPYDSDNTNNMFQGCTSLKTPIPLIPRYGELRDIFRNCSSLTRLAEIGQQSGGPNLSNAYNGCSNIEVSETQDSTYQYPYVIPANGTYNDMFANTGGSFTGTPEKGTTYYTSTPPIPSYYPVKFSSPNSFTISLYDSTRIWNGTMEYSYDRYNWTVWDGTTTLTASNSESSTYEGGTEYRIYFRGTGNTHLGNTSSSHPTQASWVITGSNVSVSGDTNSLFDYSTIATSTNQPTVDSYGLYCWLYGQTAITDASCLIISKINSYFCSHMFGRCSNLKASPILPSDTVYGNCYMYMFDFCSSLTIAPALPATSMQSACYEYMFSGCSSLTEFPYLPSTGTANACYEGMFKDCSSLTAAPKLTATTIENGAYHAMFQGCSSLKTAPDLPATTLNRFWEGCYREMFKDCTSLTKAPALPATNLHQDCYREMFYGCTSLTTAPELPATTGSSEGYNGMFRNCTSLVVAPKIHLINAAKANFSTTFQGCSNMEVFPDLSNVVGNTDWVWYDTFNGCTKLKVYTDPSMGEPLLTGIGNSHSNTFANTGGDYKGAAEDGVTYYTSNQLI